jgi:hypothetical protein
MKPWRQRCGPVVSYFGTRLPSGRNTASRDAEGGATKNLLSAEYFPVHLLDFSHIIIDVKEIFGPLP